MKKRRVFNRVASERIKSVHRALTPPHVPPGMRRFVKHKKKSLSELIRPLP